MGCEALYEDLEALGPRKASLVRELLGVDSFIQSGVLDHNAVPYVASHHAVTPMQTCKLEGSGCTSRCSGSLLKLF